MKTLSLLQPWASLVVASIKTIETRSWATSYRGALLIHASISTKGMFILQDLPDNKTIHSIKRHYFGAIIGMVQLVDVKKVDELDLLDTTFNNQSLEANAFGNSRNRYAWFLESAIAFEKPIFCKGHLQLWEFPDAMLAEHGILL